MKINSSLCSVIVPSSASSQWNVAWGWEWCRVTQIVCVRGIDVIISFSPGLGCAWEYLKGINGIWCVAVA